MTAIPERVAQRAASRFVLDAATGCHVSTYALTGGDYATLGWGENGERFHVLAHRASWVFSNGPIPDNLTVDHMCNNRRCVNVLHLRLLPLYENARRTHGRDWPIGQCVNGHDDALHLRQVSKDGKRECLECRKESRRKYLASDKGKALMKKQNASESSKAAKRRYKAKKRAERLAAQQAVEPAPE